MCIYVHFFLQGVNSEAAGPGFAENNKMLELPETQKNPGHLKLT